MWSFPEKSCNLSKLPQGSARMCTLARLVCYWPTLHMRLMRRWISQWTSPRPQASTQNLLNTSPGCLDGLFQCPGGTWALIPSHWSSGKGGTQLRNGDASPSTLRCNLDRLYETGENSQIGAGQLGKENGPTWPAEGHLPDSHLVKCQSPSPAELSAIQQSHAEFTLSYGHTPLPHSSEAIHNDLVFRRLFVVLQE